MMTRINCGKNDDDNLDNNDNKNVFRFDYLTWLPSISPWTTHSLAK